MMIIRKKKSVTYLRTSVSIFSAAAEAFSNSETEKTEFSEPCQDATDHARTQIVKFTS